MDTKALLKKVREIEIKSKGLTEQLFAGAYHSAFKGQGMSFSEVRDYQYGDDVRYIDWNVTARTGTPFIKQFEEERELGVMLVVDISDSTFFGGPQRLKREIAAEISAVLAFSAIRNNDKVGLLLFAEEVELFIPPKSGRQHILRIIRELLQYQPKTKGTRLDVALQYATQVVKRRTIFFVISDFHTTKYEEPLSLTARRHDLIGIHLFDPAERDLPQAGLLRTRHPETGQLQLIDTQSERVREAFRQQFETHQEQTRQTFLRKGATLLSLATDDDYASVLRAFFQARR